MDMFLREAFFIVIVLSFVPLVVGSGVGLLVGIVQTATQVQEQSIGFLLRFAAVSLVIGCTVNWWTTILVQFIQQALGSFASLGKIPW